MEASAAARPTIRFRNYVPRDASLVDAQTGVATVAPPRPAPSVVVAAEEAQELARLVASDAADAGTVNIAPKKPNWDLKRDLERKLARLERETQNAVADILRQRAAAAATAAGTAAATVGSGSAASSLASAAAGSNPRVGDDGGAGQSAAARAPSGRGAAGGGDGGGARPSAVAAAAEELDDDGAAGAARGAGGRGGVDDDDAGGGGGGGLDPAALARAVAEHTGEGAEAEFDQD